MTSSRILTGTIAAAAVAAFLCAGCEEQPTARTATIFGSVILTTGEGIAGVRVGVEYQTARVGSSPRGVDRVRPSSPVAEPILAPPFPNPATDAVSPGDVSVRVAVDVETSLSLEIWSSVSGVSGRVKTLFAGTVGADSTFAWDARDDFDTLVPNGLYEVRLAVPAAPPAGESPTVTRRSLLINRPAPVQEAWEAFNTVSGAAGDYVLDDLAVGESFTATALDGSVQGETIIVNRVEVIFRDPEFRSAQTTVILGPRESAEITTVLDPLFAGPTGRANLN